MKRGDEDGEKGEEEKEDEESNDDNENPTQFSVKQFGVAIKLLAKTDIPFYKTPIPTILVTLGTSLFETQGYLIEGIFRKQPNQSQCDRVKAMIDDGRIDEIEFATTEPHIIANLIKIWFRELPKSLLEPVGVQTIEQTQTDKKFIALFETIPEPNKSIFLWLLDLCAEVAANEASNQMSPHNLGVVIGPNLFEMETIQNPMKAMTFQAKLNTFTKIDFCCYWFCFWVVFCLFVQCTDTCLPVLVCLFFGFSSAAFSLYVSLLFTSIRLLALCTVDLFERERQMKKRMSEGKGKKNNKMKHIKTKLNMPKLWKSFLVVHNV
ncbi:hypothetical protein RFI_28203 [Reticulomyxa filosa]|uniref:Rho-GAP domain-containing protein n=1 Tax=Reticulomyxa filosa TaxID=46433 RepID=X6M5C4_RETFI|nr:hypothetical protein RFI_28203 [Reticulomyxa filosa]|eukprot:ETO09183.1 hypothetical protein RFI_28203 [Reticulomyxa filosa]